MKSKLSFFYICCAMAAFALAVLLATESTTQNQSACCDNFPSLPITAMAFFAMGSAWIAMGIQRTEQKHWSKTIQLSIMLCLLGASFVILAIGTKSQFVWPITYLPLLLALTSIAAKFIAQR